MRALMGSAFLSLLRQHLYGIQRILSALAEQKQLKMTAFKMSFWADFHQPSAQPALRAKKPRFQTDASRD